MAQFDQQTLRKLHGLKEVTIRTTKHPASAVTIWVVVSDADVFVRSVRGTKGRWYKDLANGGPATLEFNGEQLAVQAAPATDAVSTERASQAPDAAKRAAMLEDMHRRLWEVVPYLPLANLCSRSCGQQRLWRAAVKRGNINKS
jgi:hypothetical protein